MSDVTMRYGRRLLLDLRRDGPDRRMLRAVADLARMLDLSLHGLFVEDEALFALAALPFARELCLPTLEWRPMDVTRLQEDLLQAAAIRHRQLAEIASSAGIGHGFDVLRGDLAAAVAAVLAEGDIFAVVETAPRTDRPAVPPVAVPLAIPPLAPLLVLPADLLPRRGPIVAIVAGETPRVIGLAARLAAAAHEDLVILLVGTPQAFVPAAAAALARQAGLAASAISLRTVPADDPALLVQALAGLHERLIVMERPAETQTARGIAAVRAVPVLMLGGAAGTATAARG